MYTMCVIWFIIMLELWSKSLKSSCYRSYSLHAFSDILLKIFHSWCLHSFISRISSANWWGRMHPWQPCHIHCHQRSNTFSLVWTLPPTEWSLISEKGLSMVIIFLPTMSSLLCDWSTDRAYLSTKGSDTLYANLSQYILVSCIMS